MLYSSNKSPSVSLCESAGRRREETQRAISIHGGRQPYSGTVFTASRNRGEVSLYNNAYKYPNVIEREAEKASERVNKASARVEKASARVEKASVRIEKASERVEKASERVEKASERVERI